MPDPLDTTHLTHQRYLGDGVYGGFDGYQFILWTTRSESGRHWVALEPEVYAALHQWRKDVLASLLKP